MSFNIRHRFSGGRGVGMGSGNSQSRLNRFNLGNEVGPQGQGGPKDFTPRGGAAGTKEDQPDIAPGSDLAKLIAAGGKRSGESSSYVFSGPNGTRTATIRIVTDSRGVNHFFDPTGKEVDQIGQPKGNVAPIVDNGPKGTTTPTVDRPPVNTPPPGTPPPTAQPGTPPPGVTPATTPTGPAPLNEGGLGAPNIGQTAPVSTPTDTSPAAFQPPVVNDPALGTVAPYDPNNPAVYNYNSGTGSYEPAPPSTGFMGPPEAPTSAPTDIYQDPGLVSTTDPTLTAIVDPLTGASGGNTLS